MFEKISKHGNLRFIFELAVICLVSKAVVGIFSESVFRALGLGEMVDLQLGLQIPELSVPDFILGVIFAPLLETLLGQWLPIAVFSIFTKNKKILIAVSAAFFALLHYPALAFFPSAFVIGLILSWAWLLKRQKGKFEAFWVTTAIHFLHNLFAFIAAFLLGAGM